MSVAVLGLSGGAVYLLGADPQGGDASPSRQASATSSSASARSPAVSQRASSSAARAGVPADWTEYASTRLAYSIRYPADWVVTSATEDWSNHHPPFPFGPAVDRFGVSGDSASYVFISSDESGPDQSPAERIAQLDFINAGEGGPIPACLSSDRHAITLDGVQARQEDQVCFKTDHLIEVVVVHRDRLYLVDILSPQALTPTERTTFDQFLEAFRFGG